MFASNMTGIVLFSFAFSLILHFSCLRLLHALFPSDIHISQSLSREPLSSRIDLSFPTPLHLRSILAFAIVMATRPDPLVNPEETNAMARCVYLKREGGDWLKPHRCDIFVPKPDNGAWKLLVVLGGELEAQDTGR